MLQKEIRAIQFSSLIRRPGQGEARVIPNCSAAARRVLLAQKRKRSLSRAAAVLRGATVAIVMAALCGIINKYSAPYGIKALSGPNASTHAIQ
jgi:hypothetical protein